MTSLFDTCPALMPQIGASAVTLLLAALVRRIVPAQRARTRRLCTAGAALALGLVWLGELQSLLLSLTAVAMALVLATKELIQCATGALAGRAGRSYAVGDRVHLDGTSGRVVAVNWLTTTIAESEAGSLGSRPTGRRLVIPNSRIFAGGIHVEPCADAARRHAFSVTLEAASPLRDLLALAGMEAAARSAPGMPGPRVALATTELGKPRLDIVLFCAPDEAADAEREVALALLERAAGETRGRASLALVRERAA
ncbi:mechanosensitive ion channel family protein [Aureimonas flava]|uniref:mechanosensitive ion channel family protein n=1 Tax=Aureimonas flava TaxID=2320271 RepID=UPI001459FE72|nr:mechanosensitive ion channel family protein [Aureimonas flava]